MIMNHIITAINSTISKNKGVGISGFNVTEVTGSTISGNRSEESRGGGISGKTIIVNNSTISDNYAIGYESYGGGIYGDGKVIVTNSILSGNHVQSNAKYFHSYNPIPNGGAISDNPYGQENTTVVVNSTISGNNNAIRCASCIVVNNIFDKNDGYDVSVTSVGQIFNNYIDYAKLVGGNNFKRDNIQPGSGSLNFADSNFRIGSGSVAIDAGLSPSSTTFSNLFSMLQIDLQAVLVALATDKDNNNRIAGTAIDLGAYEYGSAAVAVPQPDCLFNWAENTYPQ